MKKDLTFFSETHDVSKAERGAWAPLARPESLRMVPQCSEGGFRVVKKRIYLRLEKISIRKQKINKNNDEMKKKHTSEEIGKNQ